MGDVLNRVLLLVAGAIHILPLVGVAGAARLNDIYGVELHDPTMVLLLRHRAVGLGAVGMALSVTVFVPSWRVPLVGYALVSALSFLLLGASDHLTHPHIRRVLIADVLAVICLVAVLARELRRWTE